MQRDLSLSRPAAAARLSALALPENPFFRREVRALGRRGFLAVLGPVLIQWTLAFVPLLLLEFPPDRSPHVTELLAALCLGVGQAIVCGAVGWSFGRRVFAEEQRQRTLEALRMI